MVKGGKIGEMNGVRIICPYTQKNVVGIHADHEGHADREIFRQVFDKCSTAFVRSFGQCSPRPTAPPWPTGERHWIADAMSKTKTRSRIVSAPGE